MARLLYVPSFSVTFCVLSVLIRFSDLLHFSTVSARIIENSRMHPRPMQPLQDLIRLDKLD